MSEKGLESRKPIEILYEDERFVVFNKPSGLLVIPSPKGEQRTLVRLVNDQISSEEQKPKLHPCHRLDRETSGIILFAKGKKNQKLGMDLFKQGKVKKGYVAFVHGKLNRREGEFRGFVKALEKRKFQKKSPARQALTKFKVKTLKKNFSVVDVEPVTGRTNQIRIHFAQSGHPLVGERKYAFARDYQVKFKRVALHAAMLQWSDPETKMSHKVSVDIPKDMQNFLSKER